MNGAPNETFFMLLFFFLFAHSPIEYEYFSKRSIWYKDLSLRAQVDQSIITSGQSVPGNNDNDGELHNSHNTRAGASPSDTL